MTTEQNPPSDNNTDADPDHGASQDHGSPKALREYADRVKAENETLRNELLDERFGHLGLSRTKGLGKAIAKEYEGPLDLDSLRSYAKAEYDYEPKAKVSTEQAADAAAVAEALDQNAVPVTPPEDIDEVAEAEARLAKEDATVKDARTSVAAKTRAFVSEHYG